MNKLKIDKQVAIIVALGEGNSIRSIERMTGAHRDTIIRLMARVGQNCHRLMGETLRGLRCRNIEIYEIWAYVGKKQGHLTKDDDRSQCGDFWIYVALDAHTKLVPSYLVGKRTSKNAHLFLGDLASRLTNRVQLSSDALSHYVDASEAAFGSNVDYGQIVKFYEAEPIGAGRYSPPHVTHAEKQGISGNPDYARISTSYVERQNLTMRMSMWRFTRLTNAFSKKVENLQAAVALHFAHYNFCRRHKTLRVAPAMEAGIVNSLWSIQDLLHAAEG